MVVLEEDEWGDELAFGNERTSGKPHLPQKLTSQCWRNVPQSLWTNFSACFSTCGFFFVIG